MRSSLGTSLLRLLGIACAAAGFLAWIGLIWTATSMLDEVSPQNDMGGRLVGWGLVGTVLMIAGMVLLHVAADASEAEGAEDLEAQR